jgi:hypothetical protein
MKYAINSLFIVVYNPSILNKVLYISVVESGVAGLMIHYGNEEGVGRCWHY